MIFIYALIMHLFGICTEYYTKDEDKGKCCICNKKIESDDK